MRRHVFVEDGAVPARRTEMLKPSPKHDEGAVCMRWVRCGRAWCRCMRGGRKHGPYYARYWWRDGRRHKRYVPRRDADQAAAACADRRQAEHDQRARTEATLQEWRGLLALIREVERGDR